MDDINEVLSWTRDIALKIVEDKVSSEYPSYLVSNIERDAGNVSGYSISVTEKNKNEEFARISPTVSYNIDIWIQDDKLNICNLKHNRVSLKLCDPNLEEQFIEQMNTWMN